MLLVQKCNHYKDQELCQKPRRLTVICLSNHILSVPTKGKPHSDVYFILFIIVPIMSTYLKHIIYLCLFLKYANGIILHTFFSFWLLLLSINSCDSSTLCAATVCSCVLLFSIPFCKYNTIMGTGVVCNFWFLYIVLL